VKGIPDDLNTVIEENLKNSKKPYFKMIADILGTRTGDVVFYYEKQVGFHGVYRVISEPFFDTTPVNSIDKTWPLRLEIECIKYFPLPVPEGYLFSSRDYETRFWGWFYRKIQGARGINTINPEAAEALIELLVKINGNAQEKPKRIGTYPSAEKREIVFPLSSGGKKVYLEDILRAWLIRNIDNPKIEGVRENYGPTEDLEWFANNVPYHVTRKSIDILTYHKNTRYTGYPLRYLFSVTELKRDIAKDKDVSQLIEYAKWVNGRLAGSEIETVQPILIAYDFKKSAISKARNCEFSDRGILLAKYVVINNEIKLARLDI